MGRNLYYFTHKHKSKPFFLGSPRVGMVQSISYPVPFANSENADLSDWTGGRNFVSDLDQNLHIMYKNTEWVKSSTCS